LKRDKSVMAMEETPKTYYNFLLSTVTTCPTSEVVKWSWQQWQFEVLCNNTPRQSIQILLA